MFDLSQRGFGQKACLAGGACCLDVGARQERIQAHIKPVGPPLDAAKHEMPDGVKRDGPAQQNVLNSPMNDLHVKPLEKAQDLHILPFADLTTPELRYPPKARKSFRKLPILKLGAVHSDLDYVMF